MECRGKKKGREKEQGLVSQEGGEGIGKRKKEINWRTGLPLMLLFLPINTRGLLQEETKTVIGGIVWLKRRVEGEKRERRPLDQVKKREGFDDWRLNFLFSAGSGEGGQKRRWE